MVPRDRTSHPMVPRVSQINQSQMQMLISMLACRHVLLGCAGVSMRSICAMIFAVSYVVTVLIHDSVKRS
jgi:energy-converting hydrogenase Eha subunit C